MWPAGVVLIAATLSGAAPEGRVLVCRARVGGDPSLARGEALSDALRSLGESALDYGVPCESIAEAGRAARRAGLSHAIVASAEGQTDGSRFELTLVDADERVLAVRRLVVPPGAPVARPLEAGLEALAAEVPRPEGRRQRRRIAVGVAGGGIALLAGGAILAAVARGEAGRANAALTPDEYLGARRSWERARGWSAAALGLGASALAAGLAWRIDLGGDP